MTVRVLVDACLLVKGNVANILLDLAYIGLIELHWTEEIESETAKNWTEIRLGLDAKARAKLGVTRPATEQEIEQKFDAALRRLDNFRAMVPEWRVPGWNHLRSGSRLLPELLKAEALLPQNVPKLKVDTKDQHVALAAMKLRGAFPADDTWLATENVDDLPPSLLRRVGVNVVIPGVLIEKLYQKNSYAVVDALQKTIDDSTTPKLDHYAMVGIMESVNEFGSDEMAEALRRVWRV